MIHHAGVHVATYGKNAATAGNRFAGRFRVLPYPEERPSQGGKPEMLNFHMVHDVEALGNMLIRQLYLT